MEEKLRQLLSGRQKVTLSGKKLIYAAVLIAIFHKMDEYHILFTRRSNNVTHHKGQISFPGGSRSEDDSSLLDTALRESWEEIGLAPEDARVAGELDNTPTATSGFIISPFVAFIPYPYKFSANPHEIVEIFDISIPVLQNEAIFKQENQISNGEQAAVYSYEYDGRIIWGATASILKQLLDILKYTS